MGIFGLRRLIFLKLVEQRDQLLLLVVGKNGEDPLLGSVFSCFLRLQVLLVISVGVARVDLYDVMDETHEHDLRDVDLLVGVFPKQISHDRHVPGVLRVVFVPSVPGKVCLPEDVLLLIDLQSKGKLFLQSFVHWCLLYELTFCTLFPLDVIAFCGHTSTQR